MEEIDALVDANWLRKHLDEVFIFDSRKYLDERSGRSEYERGHLPGAVFVDLDADLAAPPAQPGGRHPFPTPGHFATAMGRLGYDGERPAVIYDNVGGGMAARLWFMLSLIDVAAAVLDGGIQAWSGELESGFGPIVEASFAERPWPGDRLIAADDVVARIAAGGVVIDARNPSRYAGKPNRIDDRFGHIPGAINLAWEDNIDDFTGTMLPIDGFATRYVPVSSAPDAPKPVVYCGSGVTACHDLLAMHLLGMEGDLYVGSWSEWGADPARPIEMA